MKNIHILPTENSSRLSYNENGVLILNRLQWRKNTQNIYITSDEKIKEGDYVLYEGEVFKVLQTGIIYNDDFTIRVNDDYTFINDKYSLKIILTTDQDLIKDGVQAIPDEFLQWFVKNPSCEEVEVLKQGVKTKRNQWGFTWKYFIKIPKEEPKKVGEYQQELFSYLHDLGIIALQSEMQEIERIVLNMQQEQDKNKYSKEDLIDAFNEGQALNVRGKLIQGKEWFEQNKKK